MTRKIALVGCGSAKNPGVLPAKDKYSSSYFSVKRNYAEIVCDDWFIVSAKYGLLDPDKRIDDYDVSVDDFTDAGVRNLMEAVSGDLWDEIADEEDTIADDVEVHFLLGSSYLDPLKNKVYWLHNNPSTTPVFPFEGTSGIGEQMSVLNDLIEEHE